MLKKIIVIVVSFITLLFILNLKTRPIAHLSTRPLPMLQAYEGVIVSNDGSTSFPFTYSIKKVSRNLEVELKTESMHYAAIIDENLIPKYENKTYLNPPEELKFNSEIIQDNILSFFDGDQLLKEKPLSSPYPIVSAGTIIPYVQGLSADLQKSTVTMILPSVFWSQNYRIRQRLRTKEALLSDFTFPKQVQYVLETETNYVLYEIKAIGIKSFFISDRHYVLLSSEEPFDLICAWGGPKQHVMYQLSLETTLK